MTQSDRAERVAAKIRAACERKIVYNKQGKGKPYTPHRMGKEAGLDLAYAHRIWNGQAVPSRDMLTKICDAIGCTVEERADIFHAAGYLSPEEDESYAA